MLEGYAAFNCSWWFCNNYSQVEVLSNVRKQMMKDNYFPISHLRIIGRTALLKWLKFQQVIFRFFFDLHSCCSSVRFFNLNFPLISQLVGVPIYKMLIEGDQPFLNQPTFLRCQEELLLSLCLLLSTVNSATSSIRHLVLYMNTPSIRRNLTFIITEFRVKVRRKIIKWVSKQLTDPMWDRGINHS